jgi:Nif11 domain
MNTPEFSTQLEQFSIRVLADVALQDRLRQPADADDFIALAVQIARELGFDLKPDELRAAMRGRLPLAKGLIDSAVRETPPPPKGWLPVRASWHAGQLYVHWSYFGEQRLREPFYESEIHRANFKPFNRLFRYSTPISRLGDWLREHLALPPSGFIFHMGRCGSTVVSQMLAAAARTVVISEPDPVDAVLRARLVRPDLSEDEQAHWLRWMIGALGQLRCGDERHYFVKLDSWHTSALPLFRRAFPQVPWIFIYRDPVEVIVSQLRMPGSQMIPGMLDPGQFGVELPDRPLSPEDHCALMLAGICEPILQHYATDKILLVNYRQLPQAVWTTILPHFGVDFSDSDRAAMVEAARYDPKMPTSQFKPDGESKQQEATVEIRAAANEYVGHIYRRLEALRLGA